jgi:hypothetical protein
LVSCSISFIWPFSLDNSHSGRSATFSEKSRGRSKKYGGLKLDDAQKLKGLERENAELKKMLAATLLENRALKIVNVKNSEPDA